MIHASVIASEFATDKDLRKYNEAIAEGKTHDEAFAVGDNCIGCWGDPTNVNEPICAIPPDDMIKEFGSEHNAKHKKLMVTNNANNVSISCTISDVMPWKKDIKNGAGIDLNPCAVTLLGLPNGAMVPVTWGPIETAIPI